MREVMLATSQPLSAHDRRKLEETAGEAGARLAAVHDRTWLANALYRDAGWRERLIGVTGEPSALVSRPLDLAGRTWGMLDLVGRDQELRELAESRGDIVLVGPPGPARHVCSHRPTGRGSSSVTTPNGWPNGWPTTSGRSRRRSSWSTTRI